MYDCGVVLIEKKAIATISQAMHNRMTPAKNMMTSTAPMNIKVPAVWNRCSPERSASA